MRIDLTECGTGEGLFGKVFVYLFRDRFLGKSVTDKDRERVSAHVALYHELTHMLHCAQGMMDSIPLLKKPADMPNGNTYAHRGFWFIQEEKNTIAEEREYFKQCGFVLKRVNYGDLAVRIDK